MSHPTRRVLKWTINLSVADADALDLDRLQKMLLASATNCARICEKPNRASGAEAFICREERGSDFLADALNSGDGTYKP